MFLPTSITRRRLLRQATAACLLVAFAFTGVPVRATGAFTEYEVKAVFLFNFVQFVKWPPTSFSDTSAPYVIGILGNDPFGKALENTIRGEIVEGRKLTLRRAQRVEDVTDCHVIYISQSEEGRVGDILARLRPTHALTVSDITQFCRQGGMIGFVLEGGKVRFEIKSGTAKNAGLQISSRLLKLAK
jgi:YfiR/HmsC-like